METLNNHKVSRNNPGSYFLEICMNKNLLCGKELVGDAISKDLHSFYCHQPIPHKNINLTKLKAQNGLKRYHRTQ